MINSKIETDFEELFLKEKKNMPADLNSSVMLILNNSRPEGAKSVD